MTQSTRGVRRRPERRRRWAVGVIVGGSVVLGLVVFAVFIYRGLAAAGQAELQKEIVKAVVQLLVVTLIGAAIPLVIQYLREQRGGVEARRQSQYDVFAEIVGAYHSFKTVRRDLRMAGIHHAVTARSLNALDTTQIAALRRGFATLSNVDLTLEMIDRRLEVDPVFAISDEVRRNVQPMREHVEALVDEWELFGGEFTCPGAASADLQLPVLGAFLGKADGYAKLENYYRALVGARQAHAVMERVPASMRTHDPQDVPASRPFHRAAAAMGDLQGLIAEESACQRR